MAWKRRSSMRRLGATMKRGVRSTVRFAGDVLFNSPRMIRNGLGRIVDELVYTVAPAAGIHRKNLRMIMDAHEARMSSRSDDDDRDSGSGRLHGPQRWMGSRLSPDSELERDLESLRTNTKELYRDTTAGGAIDKWVDHVIGTGFTYQAKIKAQDGISEEAAKMWNEQLEGVHGRWSRKCDITGQDSLWQVSRLAARSYKYAGESFTIMWAPDDLAHVRITFNGGLYEISEMAASGEGDASTKLMLTGARDQAVIVTVAVDVALP